MTLETDISVNDVVGTEAPGALLAPLPWSAFVGEGQVSESVTIPEEVE